MGDGSSFGNALYPTDHTLEIAFSILVITCGLLLFTMLIGNIQVSLWYLCGNTAARYFSSGGKSSLVQSAAAKSLSIPESYVSLICYFTTGRNMLGKIALTGKRSHLLCEQQNKTLFNCY